MIWKKKKDSNTLGVPLGELLLMLEPTTLKAHQDGNTIVVQHEHYKTLIEVVPPDQSGSQNDPVRAVVRMTTEFPSQLKDFINEAPEIWNAFASLGAVTYQNDRLFVGSRLTLGEADLAEDVWGRLYLPLLLTATIWGAEAFLGAMRRRFAGQEGVSGTSDWTEVDMKYVEHSLSQHCLCFGDARRFSAEFGLTEGATSAVVGDRTALFQLIADQPNPEVGGGLFCLLQMPHIFNDKARVKRVCTQLNNMEMGAYDLPPHFGAWCPDSSEDNLAYVSFLPNELHKMIPGIAVNMAVWAMYRAQSANAFLALIGIRG